MPTEQVLDNEMPRRVFYAAGPGDIILAHQYWKKNERCSTEVSITFSSQIQDFCAKVNATAYFVCCHQKQQLLEDGQFTLESRPKPCPNARGIKFHLREILYGLGLLRTALSFKADVAIVDSGVAPYFVLALFRIVGIEVVPILHNALWPKGCPPRRLASRFILWLNAISFWRSPPLATICVSPECERQVRSQIKRVIQRKVTFLALAQFYRDHFEKIGPVPAFEQTPFQIVFVGRVVENKGVFDILAIAKRYEDVMPGRVRWVICGAGPDLERLRQSRKELGLDSVVEIRGWTSPQEQIEVFSRSHAAIVPTKSSFAEAMAMTAIEGVMAGRPVITSDIVPALELLRAACIEARPDDVGSYFSEIQKLLNDREFYEARRKSCSALTEPFFDRENGLAAVLERALVHK